MKFSMLATILATSGLATASPTPTRRSKKIIGGTNATIDQFPYQASIQRRVHSFDCQFNVHTCGGVIIAPNKILTAAHCVSGDDDGSDRTQFVVRAGSTDWTRGGQLVGVNGITIHPGYKPSGDHGNDLAVLTLKRNLTLGDKVAIADLADAEERMPAAGADVVVAGWGQTQAGKGQPSVLLRSLTTKVVRRWVCEFKFLRYGGIGTKDFCAGDGGEFENTWAGDSGGALFEISTKKVVGIVSFGLDAPKKGYPTVFTSIAGYREYITRAAAV
ncbi:hypothetical protein J3459_008543 [Metarhizium acridum]|uniref:Trypsin delta/gamma n=1 Tax=Metarhizium acridum (strain CQMa 102) TaxID=655827 RepID=E9DRY1_METAQ|nr:trypsin delta/gamma [Metarhizium acridum CQMa 102]EFY93563.1 trypsin delta/gamma [Metarhizium acridum CQMa 102]KAG8423180.1 hypothetical protein J3458_000096 [Metarhizium acridum]KAG8425983.1 hypothetical protein J3459_008543 [Metarhizium acridum]